MEEHRLAELGRCGEEVVEDGVVEREVARSP
jgi:hypothetical protein